MHFRKIKNYLSIEIDLHKIFQLRPSSKNIREIYCLKYISVYII